MGFNTVAFLLNDFMHELQKSPKTIAWMLSHPPHGESERDRNSVLTQMRSVAEEYGEPMPHFQALEIWPTWHADGFKFFVAGHNSLAELKWVRRGKTKDGRKTVTLEMPDWWEK